MSSKHGVAAHLIVGAREEPFLGALLHSLDGAVDCVIVNDNAPGESPHRATFESSTFASRGGLIVDRTPFTGFAAARNVCMRIHAHVNAGAWIAFVDADEVHGELVRRVASNLALVPPEYGTVDAYTWHFFASFDWYTSIERRMMFYRFSDDVYWEGAVHEQLHGLPPKKLVLPYVYAHYGHTLEARRHAEKGRQYSSLGAEGGVLREDQLDDIDVRTYYARYFSKLLRFHGTHPPAARETIASLGQRLHRLHELTDAVAHEQTLFTRFRNRVRAVNYEQRWRLRMLNPLARRLVQ